MKLPNEIITSILEKTLDYTLLHDLGRFDILSDYKIKTFKDSEMAWSQAISSQDATMCSLFLDINIEYYGIIVHPLLFALDDAQLAKNSNYDFFMVLYTLMDTRGLVNEGVLESIMIDRIRNDDEEFFKQGVLNSQIQKHVPVDQVLLQEMENLSDTVLEQILYNDYLDEFPIDLFFKAYELHLYDHFRVLSDNFGGSMEDVFFEMKDLFY